MSDGTLVHEVVVDTVALRTYVDGGDYEVWLDLDEMPFSGICIAAGRTVGDVQREAKRILAKLASKLI